MNSHIAGHDFDYHLLRYSPLALALPYLLNSNNAQLGKVHVGFSFAKKGHNRVDRSSILRRIVLSGTADSGYIPHNGFEGHTVTRALQIGDRIWLTVIVAATVFLYHRTLAYCWQAWKVEPQYSIAYLVPLVSGYFLWQKWPQVRATPRSPSHWGLLLIILAILLHLGGVLLDISGPSSVSMLVFLTGCCLYLHGTGLLRVLAFPLAYLIFAIPVPGGALDVLGFPLQLWASSAAATLLQVIGMDVTRNGVNLSASGFDVQVAAACSGMSSLVALTGVSAVFAYLTSLRPAQKWLLFFLAIPIAVMANVVRIATIVLVGYKWGVVAATTVYHKWSSPILFLVAIAILLMVNRGLEWRNTHRTT